MFITRKKPAPPHVPARGRCDARAAAARRDGAGADAPGEDGGHTCLAARLRLSPPRREHGQVDAGQRRRGLRVLADPEAARAVPPPPRRGQRTRPPRRRQHRRALAEPDDVAERRAAEADTGRRRLRRNHRRPDRRAADRAGHAAAVDGAGDRRPVGPDWRVRPRLRLHLHEHAVVADADHADADGDQPAKGVRADVRPGRLGGGPAGAQRRRPQRARRHHQADWRPAARPRLERPHDRERLSGERAGDRAAHPGRREAAGDSTSSCRRRRSASRSSSKSTSS